MPEVDDEGRMQLYRTFMRYFVDETGAQWEFDHMEQVSALRAGAAVELVAFYKRLPTG